MSSRTRASLRSTAALLGLATLSALAVTLALVLGGEWLRPPSPTTPQPSSDRPMSTPFFSPGLQRPPAVPAATAAVPDDAEVLGVTVNGRNRAYLITTLSRVDSHVIDDLIEDVPITVTFCDKSQCARVFTAPDHPSPLKVDLGGLRQDKLLLRLNNVFYDQESGDRIDGVKDMPFPYPDHPFVRTTWKKWKEAHPETDIFVGKPAGEQGGPPGGRPPVPGDKGPEQGEGRAGI